MKNAPAARPRNAPKKAAGIFGLLQGEQSEVSPTIAVIHRLYVARTIIRRILETAGQAVKTKGGAMATATKSIGVFALTALLGLVLLGLVLLDLPLSSYAQCVAPRDMNGVWKANDGGTYYVRQIGNDVWWLGMSGDGGRTWTNVYRGVRNRDIVTGTWADVPHGQIHSSGILNLHVD